MLSKKIQIFLLLLMTATTILNQEETPYERILYNQSFKAKRGSLIGFDLAAAFAYNTSGSPQITTTEGQVKSEAARPNIFLSNIYRTSTILRIDTYNAFLVVIGFNNQENKCFINYFKSESSQKLVTFKNLSRTECNRVRVTRTSKNELMSYISDQGKFMWRTNYDSTYPWCFSTGQENLFDGILDKQGFHDVQALLGHPEKYNGDVFVVYQKSRRVDSEKFFGKIAFYYSDAKKRGEIDQLENTMTYKESVEGYFDMVPDLDKDSFKLEELSFRTEYQYAVESGLWMTFKGDNNSFKKYFIGIDTQKLMNGERQGFGKLFASNSEFDGTVNTENGNGFSHFFKFLHNGYINVCRTKTDFFQFVKSNDDFEFQCSERQNKKKFDWFGRIC